MAGKKRAKKKIENKKQSKYISYRKDPLTKKIYQNVIDTYTKAAYVYDDKWKQYLASTEQAILQQLKLKGKETIVDAGCGTGSLLAAIREKFKHRGKIIGFDITPAMLDLAEAKLTFKSRFNTSLELELAHCENFSVKNNSVDVIICSSVLHHLPHPEKALHAFHRALKKGGRLLLVDFCTDYPTTQFIDWWQRLFHPAHHRAYRSSAVDEMLHKNKFSVVSFKTWKATPTLGVMLFDAKKK
ncbi:class I SAM-dependent methyltransferase [Candidatus Woesearchaeota archaeon]|nr:class I SAM-dependent methyltransferase [Candidatus Woesearchaeota archaeon]